MKDRPNTHPVAVPPGLAPSLPPGFVESQHQMTGQPYIPGAVPTKPAPGSR